MRNKINILGAILLFMVLAYSCVDDTTQLFNVEKPASIEQMEYLNEYDALKTYIDRSANPNFKLGAGVTVSDYIKQGLTYRAINSNFDRVTAGNAMKYASIVKDDGSMDFGQVVQFVTAAQAAGTEIYGHTLLWHAQQNKKYLNSLIADKEIEGDPNATEEVVDGFKDYSTEAFTGWVGGPVKPVVENGVLVVTNTEAQPGFWDIQYHVAGGISIKENTTHKVTIRIRGTVENEITVVLGTWESQQNKKLPITQEWKEVSVELNSTINAGDAFVMLQSGNYVGTYEIEWVKVTHEEKIGGSVTLKKYIFQSDFEDGVPLGGWGNSSTREVINGELVITNPSKVNFWEAQAAIDFAQPLEEGETYFLNLKIKGNTNGAVRPGFQDPSDYSSGGDYPILSFTTDWKEFTLQTNVTKETVTRFLFSFGDFAGTIYIDDLALYREESANSIPLTPEEKADTLTWALDQWIEGMMTATDGYVLAWDVANEVVSGADTDGDGIYDLWSAENVSEEDAKNNFYWRDYLGDDFIRIAVESARKHGPDGLKLFINDYNLESDWDDNQKLKSLIKWIERWESDGVTVIDGIGTQMHVSCYMNPETQASKEEHVVKMFELMAATGKMVLVTELDMGVVDEDGVSVLTSDATEEHHKAMSDYYKFIVEKYLEIIPPSQQAGITHWCPTDSPASSSWRGGEPVGLWTEQFQTRKHAYAGFADGLSGK